MASGAWHVPDKLPELADCLSENDLTIPDELTRHLLRTVGVDVRDDITLRVVSLAAQRFTASVLNDAYLLRAQKYKALSKPNLKTLGIDVSERAVLTTEDLSNVLEDAGVHLRYHMYYVDAKSGK